MAKKTYVLDTSALVTNTDCVNGYSNNDILIPIKVLEELDKHKKRQDLVGASARTVIRFLDSLRSKGSVYEGVRLGKGKGILKVKGYDPLMSFPAELDLTVPDHQILAVVCIINIIRCRMRIVVVVVVVIVDSGSSGARG